MMHILKASQTETSRVVCCVCVTNKSFIRIQISKDWLKLYRQHATYFVGTVNDQAVGDKFEEAHNDAHDEHEGKQIVADLVVMIFHYLVLFG